MNELGRTDERVQHPIPSWLFLESKRSMCQLIAVVRSDSFKA